MSSYDLRFFCGSKTTLLDVIAGYKTGGRITGDLSLSGPPKTHQVWQLLSGYAEQNDLLNPYLTVMETLKFTASCRLPVSMNRSGVINKIVRLMSLDDWTDYVVGVEKEGEGVPKHVRKRVTIAVQLVMLPKILFLDVRSELVRVLHVRRTLTSFVRFRNPQPDSGHLRRISLCAPFGVRQRN